MNQKCEGTSVRPLATQEEQAIDHELLLSYPINQSWMEEYLVIEGASWDALLGNSRAKIKVEPPTRQVPSPKSDFLGSSHAWWQSTEKEEN
ncbi:hypothetical protein VNO78_08370 [Psophocarpus tetragonolobus]|uniref:Uncharacterized protein n=1 Tax=Psophocarpus tetragonolobus TaxID=3891 RepID=A0AAN9SW09_PSOTE